MCLERTEYNFVKDFVPKECYHEILEVKSMTLIAIEMEANPSSTMLNVWQVAPSGTCMALAITNLLL